MKLFRNKNKKRIKKNPSIDEIPLTETELIYLFRDLINAVVTGDSYRLSEALRLLKIGGWCNDCDKEYYNCQCDDCEDCGLAECLCQYNVNKHSYNHYFVRVVAWNLIKELFGTSKHFYQIKRQILLSFKKTDTFDVLTPIKNKDGTTSYVINSEIRVEDFLEQ